MFKKITARHTAFTGVLFLLFSQSNAQGDFNKALEAGLEDANTLIEGYVSPFMKGFGTGLASGWYNTAKPHKTLGFDLTVTASAAFIPDEDLFYEAQLKNAVYDPAGPQRSPTIFGSEEEVPTYIYTYEDEESGEVFTGSFDGPGGLDIKKAIGIQAMPAPMVQLGIGVIRNTDLKIRWTPEMDFGDGKFQLLGFGVMHDLKQYLPGMKESPLEISGFVGFTKVNSEVAFEQELQEGSAGVSTDNGLGIFNIKTLTVQGLISRKFSVFTLYGGVGYNRVRSELKLSGDYEVKDDMGLVSTTYTDPLDLTFSEAGPRATAGVRLKLAVITLHADYTLQKYNLLNVGVGLSVK